MVQSDVRESDSGAKPTLDWSSGDNAVCYAKGKSHWMQTVSQFPRQDDAMSVKFSSTGHFLWRNAPELCFGTFLADKQEFR